MNSHQLINQDSGSAEWYTPAEIIEAAARCMGGIDLDPASTAKANETVGANTFFTKDDDGLSLPWHGNVWLNPPFGRGVTKLWVAKAIHEAKRRNTGATQLCMIVYSNTGTRWFTDLLRECDSMCILSSRTRFIGEDGNAAPSPTKGCTVFYFGFWTGHFANAFAHLGEVFEPLPH